jgi:Mrp family chromosome partitioning ATPase
MSTEQSVGESSQKTEPQSPNTAASTTTPQQSASQQSQQTPSASTAQTPPDATLSSDQTQDTKPSAERPDQKSDTTSPSTPDFPRSRPRQVIAVSASKGPAAFFNLARKFLVTDEICDLSALEGAIVSAADAAHLLERSKLATIIRYVR